MSDRLRRTPRTHAALALLLTVALGMLASGCGSGSKSTPPPPALTLTGVAPDAGSAMGGTAITLTGTNFLAGATVSVGGNPATALVVVGATTITCTTPPGTPGTTVGVSVTTAAGTVTLAGAFTYAALPTLTAIAPDRGSTAGGATVTLTGTGFRAHGAAGTNSVTIGGVAAVGVLDTSDTTITCTAPPGAAGAVDVVVTNANGSATLAGGFTYVAPLLYAAEGGAGWSPIPGTNLYTVDPASGALTLVGPIGFKVTGLAFAPDGTLYGVEAVGQSGAGVPNLLTISTVTGAGTVAGALVDAMADPVYIGDISFHGSRLFGVDRLSPSGFFEIDLVTTPGLVTLISNLPIEMGLKNLATSPAGSLFTIESRTTDPEGTLYRVDEATGVATLVSVLSGDAFVGGALGWCASTFLAGTFFALDGGSDGHGNDRVLVSIDPVTGVRTNVGSTGNAVLDALAGTVP
jgi:hypothetical protein